MALCERRIRRDGVLLASTIARRGEGQSNTYQMAYLISVCGKADFAFGRVRAALVEGSLNFSDVLLWPQLFGETRSEKYSCPETRKGTVLNEP